LYEYIIFIVRPAAICGELFWKLSVISLVIVCRSWVVGKTIGNREKNKEIIQYHFSIFSYYSRDTPQGERNVCGFPLKILYIFIYIAGRYYGLNQPVLGKTGTHDLSPTKFKRVKSDVRRGRRRQPMPQPSNLSPAACCQVLSVIRGDGLYTRPRRPERTRITTRAHNAHTLILCIIYQTWSVGWWGSWDVFDFFSVSFSLSPPLSLDSNFFTLPESQEKSLRAFYPQPVYVFEFQNSVGPSLLLISRYTTTKAVKNRKYIRVPVIYIS